MARVLEEVTDSEIDQQHIAKRVDDWVDRIEKLYGQLEKWLPEGWTADRAGTVRMHEQLMQTSGVSPRDFPVLRLSHRNKPSVRIEPRGLWIIGVNGRLDLFRGKDQFIIIDTAENFDPPNWQIAPISDRSRLQRLSRQSFIDVL